MIHDPANAVAAASPSDTKLRGLLGGMSVFTMDHDCSSGLGHMGQSSGSRSFDPVGGVRLDMQPQRDLFFSYHLGSKHPFCRLDID